MVLNFDKVKSALDELNSEPVALSSFDQAMRELRSRLDVDLNAAEFNFLVGHLIRQSDEFDNMPGISGFQF